MTQVVTRTITTDVPEYGQTLSAHELRALVTRSGSHFFDRDTMRYFRSRMDGYTFAAPDGWYFVTSEQQDDHHARAYTVRFLTIKHDDLNLYELNGFQEYATLSRARTVARRAARATAAWCTVCDYRLAVAAPPADQICSECQARIARGLQVQA